MVLLVLVHVHLETLRILLGKDTVLVLIFNLIIIVLDRKLLLIWLLENEA